MSVHFPPVKTGDLRKPRQFAKRFHRVTLPHEDHGALIVLAKGPGLAKPGVVRLRRYLPAVRSLLMDSETLVAHRGFRGQESKPSTAHEPQGLEPEERFVFEGLKTKSAHFQ